MKYSKGLMLSLVCFSMIGIIGCEAEKVSFGSETVTAESVELETVEIETTERTLAKTAAEGISVKIDKKNVTQATVTMNQEGRKKIKVYLGNKKIANKKITFKTTKKVIVSVSKKGVIKAKRAGMAKIKIWAKRKGKKYQSWVRVHVVDTNQPTDTVTVPSTEMKIRLKVGDKTFPARLYQNETTQKFSSMLPMTIKMEELNGNEKYYYFDESFPKSAKNPGTIHAGDIKLYGSDCLVVFYKTFDTSYNYTDLGYVEDAEEFAKAVGKGNVKITFEKAE